MQIIIIKFDGNLAHTNVWTCEQNYKASLLVCEKFLDLESPGDTHRNHVDVCSADNGPEWCRIAPLTILLVTVMRLEMHIAIEVLNDDCVIHHTRQPLGDFTQPCGHQYSIVVLGHWLTPAVGSHVIGGDKLYFWWSKKRLAGPCKDIRFEDQLSTTCEDVVGLGFVEPLAVEMSHGSREW